MVGLRGLSIYDPAPDLDNLSPVFTLHKSQSNDVLSHYTDDDSASMTSRTSSAKARRLAKKAAPAMDLSE
jgi:hypothetical protein